MANAYVSTASDSLGGTMGSAGLVQKAYDRLLEFALRSEPLIRSVADKRPAKQSIPGSTVVLQRYVDLSPATTALTETTDPDAVALPATTTLDETAFTRLEHVQLLSMSGIFLYSLLYSFVSVAHEKMVGSMLFNEHFAIDVPSTTPGIPFVWAAPSNPKAAHLS